VNDWTLFRQSLFTELPHYWRYKDDTNIRIAHFIRRHFGAGSAHQKEKKNMKTNNVNQLSNPTILTDPAHIQSQIEKQNNLNKKFAAAKRLKLDMNRFTGV
jgi:hypothetical protein